VLHGLLRVRGFTQDDAHIFCRPDQVKAEIAGCVDFMRFFLNAFGFKDFHVYLSTRDQAGKYAGSLDDWDMATGVLREVIQERGLPYDVDEGGAVFYGPKIDVKFLDALGREWQCTTIQFDFNLPERFDVTYVAEDGRERRPYMVHRALLGSIERFFGVLVEHYAGAFPVWLAPVQAVVIPISDRHNEYARKVGAELQASGVRTKVDDSSERMNQRIRQAQLGKVPYMLVVGDKEMEAGAVSVRLRTGKQLPSQAIAEFKDRIGNVISTKSLEL
jgi:threonyl-tRNA synthetase